LAGVKPSGSSVVWIPSLNWLCLRELKLIWNRHIRWPKQ
jgi:hypothetical protein